ncbi:MAG: type II toxin-antitoxin system VapC family toxin [Verrucomicrobiales bacterium]|nr:type II toxin-antitoxin system VapC family toxin [Verrucomicrobiales bacterium]
MTGLDTNVLIRYLTQDDESQFRIVLSLLTKKGAVYFLPDLVLLETNWVLQSVYGWSDEDAMDAFERLMTIHNLVFENEARLRRAIGRWRNGADFHDAWIVDRCMEQGCGKVATFDKGMAKLHPRSVLLLK